MRRHVGQISLPVSIRVDVLGLVTREGISGVSVSLEEIGGGSQIFPNIATTGADGTTILTLGFVAIIPDGYRVKIAPTVNAPDFEPQEREFFLSDLYPPTMTVPGVPEGEILAEFFICLPETPPLICEISEKQIRTAGQLAILDKEWSGPNDFTIDQAHAFMMNQLPIAPQLTQPPLSWIQDVSWGLMDFAIPLEEWDVVLRERARVMKILNEIPFPEVGGKDWIFR